MAFEQRTIGCGELRDHHNGSTVTLNGWAHKVRDLGGLFFVDVRDRTGIVQVMIAPEMLAKSGDIRSETCLSLTGNVRMRSESTRNSKMPTGDIEIEVTEYEVLSPSKPVPFPISDEEQMLAVNEELRVKYRYLDLRRPAMYRKLALRHAAVRKIRSYLDNLGFLELETPIITKSTPEGARDYLVPYRLEPGKFYALPQSPQQYKQLLMVAGMERYYQIARCFRDESQRADRQPEFTQLDVEMAFVTQEDVLKLAEGLTLTVVNELITEFELPIEPIQPFFRLTYDQSMRDYASDKPDLRFDLKVFDVTDDLRNCEFAIFKNAIESGSVIRGLRYPGGATMSRKEISEVEEFCKGFGAKGMAWLALSDGEGAQTASGGQRIRGSIAKFLKPEELQAIVDRASALEGDLLCFIADEYMAGNNVLSRLRNLIGDRCGLRKSGKMAFGWVLDFPLVEWDTDSQRWSPSHHPFTSPKEEDLAFLESDPGRVRADCYDIVCNGTEWASGSIRIHRPDIQARIFTLLGIDEATQRERFGHILDAFSFGAPPHGGLAPGIDRLIMLLLNEDNIREVIAFPKMGSGYDPMMDAPSTIDPQQWAEMGLRLS